MRRISLVISDVDGTLVTQDKVLTARAIAAVQRLHENGIGFSICSSRPPFGLRMLIEKLRLNLPFGGYNAGAIVEPDPDLTIVEQKLIPPDAAREAVALFQQQAIDCWVFAGNHWVIANPTGDQVDRETRTIQTPPTIVPVFEEAHFAAVGKIVGPSKDHDRVAQVTELLRAALAGRARAARSQPYYCDVIPAGIDKGRLIELLGGASASRFRNRKFSCSAIWRTTWKCSARPGLPSPWAMRPTRSSAPRTPRRCRMRKTASRWRLNATSSAADCSRERRGRPWAASRQQAASIA